MEGSCVADDDASQKLKARESTSDASHEEQSETCSLYPKLRPSGGGNSHDSSQYPKPEKVALATVGTTLKSNVPSKMGLKSKKEAIRNRSRSTNYHVTTLGGGHAAFSAQFQPIFSSCGNRMEK